MKEQQISHALVFSNSMLAHNWSFMDLHRALNLSIERTVLIFCNHGGASEVVQCKWYRHGGPCSSFEYGLAFVEYCSFNPFNVHRHSTGAILRAGSMTQRGRKPLRSKCCRLDNGELEEWKDCSEELRSLARRCFRQSVG